MAIIRKTKSLLQILEVFEKSQEAITTSELCDSLKSSMNKSTIYRLLDRLQEEGIVHSFLDNTGMKWYAKCQGCDNHTHYDVHPHFQCQTCGKVECVDIKINLPIVPDKTVEGTHFLIFGRCELCN